MLINKTQITWIFLEVICLLIIGALMFFSLTTGSISSLIIAGGLLIAIHFINKKYFNDE